MKKSEIQTRMTDYIEGDMSLSERALVDAHLDANPEMRDEVDELRRSVDLLRALPDEPGPMRLADQVMQRIREGEGKPPLWVRARRSLASGGSLSWAVPAVAATAVAAVAIVRGDLVVPGLSPMISGGQLDLAADASSKTTVVARVLAPSEAASGSRGQEATRAASERLRSLVARRSADGQALIGASAAPELPVAENGQPVEAVDLAESTRLAARPRETEAPGTGPVQVARVESTQVGPTRQVAAATQRPSAPAVRVQPVSSETTGAPVTVGRPTGPTGPAGAEFVVQVAADEALPLAAEGDSDRGQQQLDRRLDLLLQSPSQFMQELRGDSVAAQELWLGELAARAVERNIDDRIVAALENSGDVEALAMAGFFAQAVEQSKSDTIASELPTP